jgi:hypothetical protein
VLFFGKVGEEILDTFEEQRLLWLGPLGQRLIHSLGAEDHLLLTILVDLICLLRNRPQNG